MVRPNNTTIDPDLCTGCGLCVEECPHDTLELIDDLAVATGEHSMGCDHCAAICPADAVTVGFVDPEATRLETLQVSDAWIPFGQPSAEALIQLMRSRRSTRDFQPEPVPLPVLRDLVRVGLSAPSGTNTQAWTFTILSDRPAVERLAEGVLGFFERLNKLAGNTPVRLASSLVMKGNPLGRYYEQYYARVSEAIEEYRAGGRERLTHRAPAAILIGSRPDSTTPVEDASLAAQNILLAAHAMGYGTCLVGFAVEAMARDAGIKRSLGIPDDEKIRAVIVIGRSGRCFERAAGRAKAEVRVL